ncbi:MAG: putative anti-sigma factor antagonist [Firmicutes bacterium]|nr:putative anti-sigma factor antagonist [Bacillota bacterium]
MEIKTVGEIKIPVIIARVDASNAKGVEANLSELINSGTKKIICNFSQNEYISSAGLRVFLTILKALQRSGGKIVLCGLNPYVREVFDMAGFSQLFKIFENEEEAIKNMP